MISKITKNTKGIDVVEFPDGLNIWFDRDIDHHEFWSLIELYNIKWFYIGLDQVNGKYGDCYFFYF